MNRQTPGWTSEFVGKVLGLSLKKAHFSTLSTDTRTLPSGALFIAVKGENVDGHQFIGQAIQKGAAGVLHDENFPIDSKLKSSSCVFIPVKDPVQSYRQLSKAWRALFPIPVIGIGGSVGKTTTKELLAAILSGKYQQILKTHKSENGFIGIPMTLTRLLPEHEIAVIEIGIDQIGAMKEHVDIVQPTHSVLTAIGPEHLEKLLDIDTVAKEEALLLTETQALGGKVAVNLDDPWIKPLSKKFKSSPSFSLGKKSAASTNRLVGEIIGETLHLHGLGFPKGCKLPLPLPGTAHARNLLAAVTVAKTLGLQFKEIKKGLESFEGLEGRLQIVKLLKPPITFVCDYYNANPSSVKTALEALSTQRQKKSKIFACLADMLELGKDEIRLHQDLSKDLESYKTDFVYLFGPRMESLRKVLESSKKFKGEVQHFQTQEDLGKVLLGQVQKGDTVLIKGSRGMKMEKLWHFVRDQLNSRGHD